MHSLTIFVYFPVQRISKISLIRAIRLATGLGLRDSKDIADRVCDGGMVTRGFAVEAKGYHWPALALKHDLRSIKDSQGNRLAAMVTFDRVPFDAEVLTPRDPAPVAPPRFTAFVFDDDGDVFLRWSMHGTDPVAALQDHAKDCTGTLRRMLDDGDTIKVTIIDNEIASCSIQATLRQVTEPRYEVA